MKTDIIYFKLICVCFLTTIAMGCSKFLDITPHNFIDEDSFWKTGNDAEDALTGCYRVLNEVGQFGEYTAFMLENLTPNAYHKDNYHSTHDFAIGAQSATTEGLNLDWWNTGYKGIGRCNTLIARIEDIDMDSDLKSRIIGEAKFLRAYFYWKMNFVFHGVPLILSEPNLETQKDLPRDSYDVVFEQVLADLDDAINALPMEYDAADNGRATKGAALTLKAYALMGHNRFNEAVHVCSEIEDLHVYELFPDYKGIFKEANIGNSEVIFDVRWSYPKLYVNYDIYSTQYNIQVPVQELVDAYEMVDGKSINESPLYDPVHPMENRDPRLNQTMSWVGKPYRGRLATAADWHQTGYGFMKITEYDENTVETLTNSSTPYIIFRYGGLLLLYAEALNESNENPPGLVYDLVNRIRARPSVDMPPIEDNLSREEMRDVIRHERRIELAGEGDYFFSIRRWRIAEDVMNGTVHAGPFDPFNGRAIETRHFTERDYLWPIPFTEIDLNPNLKPNNPGY